MKQMLIERPIIYLPRKNSATASGSICDYFFVLGNDANDLLCFFANIGLISPFLQSYTCLKTMLQTLWKDSQQDIEFTVNSEPIHKVFNILRRTCSSIQPSSKQLESMMNKHFCLVHLETKSLKPKMKRKLIFTQLASYSGSKAKYEGNFKSTFFFGQIQFLQIFLIIILSK